MISDGRRRKDGALVKKLRKARKEKAAELQKKGETVPEEESWVEFKFNQILDSMPEASPEFVAQWNNNMAMNVAAAKAAGASTPRDLSAADETTSTSTRVVTPRGVTKPIEPVKV